MKGSLEYINSNVECGLKILNKSEEYKLQYIKDLPKTHYFKRG